MHEKSTLPEIYSADETHNRGHRAKHHKNPADDAMGMLPGMELLEIDNDFSSEPNHPIASPKEKPTYDKGLPS